MLKLLIGVLLFLAGCSAGAFFLMSIICVRVGIPLARRWYKIGYLTQRRTGYYIQSAMLTFFTGTLINFLVYVFCGEGIAGSLAGTLLVVLGGFGQTGCHPRNLADFLERNSEYLDRDKAPTGLEIERTEDD